VYCSELIFVTLVLVDAGGCRRLWWSEPEQPKCFSWRHTFGWIPCKYHSDGVSSRPGRHNWN